MQIDNRRKILSSYRYGSRRWSDVTSQRTGFQQKIFLAGFKRPSVGMKGLPAQCCGPDPKLFAKADPDPKLISGPGPAPDPKLL